MKTTPGKGRRRRFIFDDLRYVPIFCKERAERHLRSWTHLAARNKKRVFTVKEIKQLITTEYHGVRRPHMLKRLVGMLHTAERKEIYRRLGL